MIIENAIFDVTHFAEEDVYIFAVGYEHRSYYIYDLVKEKLAASNTIIFVFDDYLNHTHVSQKISEIEKCREFDIDIVNYSTSKYVHKKVLKLITEKISQCDSITVHIDYSSMPRSWYCELPLLLRDLLRDKDKINFWYSEGAYPDSYEEFPSAGIEAFSFFAGKPSLQVDRNRIHILALGYDVVRTQAIISIIDPDYFVACYAYNENRREVRESVKIVNKHHLSQAAMTLALHINDFSFMVSKLRETANELLPTGDVIFVPDGPKPLIFAISMIPDLLNKSGIACLHVSRNMQYFKPIDVIATGSIYGFTIQNLKKV